MISAIVHISRNGEWLDSPVDLSQATLVASSRSHSTEVFRTPDQKLIQVYWLKSGNVELTELETIPDSLIVRYQGGIEKGE